MAEGPVANIAIVGVGLLGGSLGLAAKAADPATRVVGIGRRQSSLEEALDVGAVDAVTLDPAEGVRQADLVILCTPVGRIAKLLAACLPGLPAGAVVTDVGSTKADIVAEAEAAMGDRAGDFVGSHPIAGSEHRGVAWARADLYNQRTCVLTPTDKTRPRTLQRVRRFWQWVGMRTVKLSPADHDRALARVSHLPHAVAASLVAMQDASDLDLAGTGFVDTTRIAGGDPVMWRDIFLSNAPACLEALDDFAAQAAALAKLIRAGDGEGIEHLLGTAQSKRAKMLDRRFRRGQMEP